MTRSVTARRAERAVWFGWGLRLLLGSPPTEPVQWILGRWVFLRLLGVVYLIAFVSLWVQVIALIGKNGILPVADYLPAVLERFGSRAYGQYPTLCWLDSSDTFLHFLCGGGAVLSCLLIAGMAPIPVLILLWAFYLSLVTAGQTFLSFQWDILLLETGFLAVFLAPQRLLPRIQRESPPPRMILFLLRWLLFRLMLLSGLVKLWAGDEWWTNLRALSVHYETQPLPAWTSWYAHQLPERLHEVCVGVMFGIELGLPFLIFLPRRPRLWAFFGFVTLMLLIALTGNYNFFNLLTVTLCVTLLDDATIRRALPRRLQKRCGPTTNGARSPLDSPVAPVDPQTSDRADVPRPSPRRRWWRWIPSALFAAFVLLFSLIAAESRLSRCPGFEAHAAPARRWLGQHLPQASARIGGLCETGYRWIAPFSSVNAYGLFQSMTTTRPEIVIEGSNDGREWRAYEFRWKPGALTRPPTFVQPHQPRLDWQMWFAALRNFRSTPWFGRLMQRLLEGEPHVLALFDSDPFPDRPPRYLRAVLYRYHFTDEGERRNTGRWWRRENLGLYCPPLSRRSP